jgi:photosystem II stability/assembly factor-like uncharacterized protein
MTWGRRGVASFIGSASFLALLSASMVASGHAPPQATGIFFEAGDGATAREWVRTNRGLILRAAPGDPARLLCNDAYSASLSEVAPMLAVSDGLVVATYYGGILRIGADGCSVEPAEAPLDGRRVLDLSGTSDTSTLWALVAPNLDRPGCVMASVDAGRTWNEAGEIAAFGSALRAAPSDTRRLYVTAQVETDDGEGIHQLLVSDDAGAEFAPYEVMLLDSEVRAYVLSVHPTDAERVFLRTLAGNPSDPERLLASEDGGKSFSEVASAVGPLVLEFDVDTETLWLGGRDGLWRSDDDGRSFESVPQAPTHIGCLSATGGSFLACGHQDLRFGVFEMAADGGEFRSALHFNEVTEQVSCAEDAAVVALCRSNFEDWLEEQGSPTMGAAGATGSDGGSANPPQQSEQAGCSIRSPRRDAATAALLVALSLVARRRAGSRRRT